ncbi:Ca2+ regulator and membrane fusion protein Fig1-domain-containing protein [Diplogelasinospora grovesii]|uniref:Ca2+ regulator and membrane fusion protein Fig1-domain-containing protein n=1 Tax=Diplogelasinospora grovesii TaxID=303347 RepID=A0AAN6NBT1_9PEZI|nr:Ca2+ regulator and membrane fusion protein Fig1-domain-containing protein [Diplogelasinospora grovesii]
MGFLAKITPKLNLRMIPYILVIPIVLFQALSLAGCVSTSPSIPGLYIVSLQTAKNTSTPVQVRLGYFGICGGAGNESTFKCQSSSGQSADTVAANLFSLPSAPANGTKSNTTTSSTDEVKNLVATALDLQSQIFISILAGAAVLFFLGLIFLALLKRDIVNPNPDKPRHSAIIKKGTFGLLYLSTALAFTAALATSETAGALQYSSTASSNSTILIKPGISLQVLQWMAFGFSLLFTLAVPWLVRPGWGGEKMGMGY